jgi:hypothetical protein
VETGARPAKLLIAIFAFRPAQFELEQDTSPPTSRARACRLRER